MNPFYHGNFKLNHYIIAFLAQKHIFFTINEGYVLNLLRTQLSCNHDSKMDYHIYWKYSLYSNRGIDTFPFSNKIEEIIPKGLEKVFEDML